MVGNGRSLMKCGIDWHFKWQYLIEHNFIWRKPANIFQSTWSKIYVLNIFQFMVHLPLRSQDFWVFLSPHLLNPHLVIMYPFPSLLSQSRWWVKTVWKLLSKLICIVNFYKHLLCKSEWQEKQDENPLLLCELTTGKQGWQGKILNTHMKSQLQLDNSLSGRTGKSFQIWETETMGSGPV